MLENNGRPALGTDLPGDRISCLSAASLRVNGSLDVDTALRAVLTIGQAQAEATFAGRTVPRRRND